MSTTTAPIPEAERIQILIERAKGRSVRAVARQMKCSPSSVTRITEKWEKERTVHPAKRRRRHVFFSPTKRKQLIQFIKRHRRWNNHRVRQKFKDVYNLLTSNQTIQRTKKDLGFKSVEPRRRPYITPAVAAKRLKYARENDGEEWAGIGFVQQEPIFFWYFGGGIILFLGSNISCQNYPSN